MRRKEINNPEEILVRLQEEEAETKTRLILLNLVGNHHMKVEEACEITGTPVRTAYDWIERWNREGYEGIRDKPKGGGRPPKLKEEDVKKLKEYLQERPYWTTEEVRRLIKERFEVELSLDQVRRILREKLGMNFSKPYPLDYRRSPEAPEILAGNLETVLNLLKEKGIREEEMAIGFLDESSPQLTANVVRVWSFGKPKIFKNTTRMKANTIGFYAIKGESVQDFLEDSRGESVAKFLRQVRERNSRYKAIILLADNFKSHLDFQGERHS